MKKTILILTNILFCAIIFAQSVPQGINYQAVARDASGSVLANEALMIRLSVISGSSTGSITWQEEHSVSTNDFGLFTVVIGLGTSTSAGSSSNFSDVNWASASHYLKVEINDGSGYTDMGTNQLLSVPYALVSATSEDSGDNLGNHLATQTLDLDTNDLVDVRYIGFKRGGQLNSISTNLDGDLVFTANTATSLYGVEVMKIVDGSSSSSGVSIGADGLPSGYKLSVDGKVICEELTVQLSTAWPDYVFANNYNLISLKELENYIEVNKHLPNIPPASEIENGGVEMGEMTRLLMEKVEELTLYMIDANNRIQELETELKNIK